MNTLRKIKTILPDSEMNTVVMLIFFMMVGMFLETLGVGLVIPAIHILLQDDLIVNYPFLQPVFGVLGSPDNETLIIIGMSSLLGIYFIKNVFLAFLAWYQARFTYKTGALLSKKLFSIYLYQPYTFHLQRNSALLIRNVMTEVGGFISATQACMMFLTEVLVMIGLCVLLVVIEPLSTVIVAFSVGSASWAFYYFTRDKVKNWGQARQHHEGLRIQHLQQGLSGAKDVKLLGREEDFLEQYSLHNEKSAYVGRMITTLKQLPRLWLELLAIGGLVILVLSMLWQERAMESVLPTLALFAVAAFRLMPSVNRILGAIQTIRFDMPVINVLYEELRLSISKKPHSNNSSDHFHNNLVLNNIFYTYKDAPAPSLENISLTIKRGESVGIIGTSGAGKSTLVDILLGLITPDTGEVRVDGEDIQDCIRHWQDQIGYVPQSIYLTDDSLCRNVAFGLPDKDIDESAVWDAIRAAQLEEYVKALPQGLNTLVGERGVRLSGGQRQRIGIARALYHDPPVLVLDEATSSLDNDTETGVMQAVQALHGMKTVIIVAHRLGTVEHCDRLYRLEQGEVVEEGKTEEILGYSKRKDG